MIGVYGIYCKPLQCWYIGSSKDIERRLEIYDIKNVNRTGVPPLINEALKYYGDNTLFDKHILWIKKQFVFPWEAVKEVNIRDIETCYQILTNSIEQGLNIRYMSTPKPCHYELIDQLELTNTIPQYNL